MPFGAPAFADEGAQAQRDGEHLLLVEVDQRREEFLPLELREHDGGHRQRRFAHGQHDAQVDLEVAGAVHARRVVEVQGNRHEELAQQKDEEGVAREEGRRDQRQIGIHPAQVAEEHEGGDQRHLVGQHHGGQQHQEEQVATGPAQAREGEGHQAGGHDRAGGGHADHEQRVEKPATEGLDGHRFGEVAPDDRVRNPARRELGEAVGRLERGGERPGEGDEDDDRARQQHEVNRQAFRLFQPLRIAALRWQPRCAFRHLSAPSATPRNRPTCWRSG